MPPVDGFGEGVVHIRDILYVAHCTEYNYNMSEDLKYWLQSLSVIRGRSERWTQ